MKKYATDTFFLITGYAFDFSRVLVIVGLCLLLIHVYIATIMVVQGTSMYPTFKPGDVILVDKIDYLLRAPARGETIVFQQDGKLHLKRIAGLPADSIEVQNGVIVINGLPYNQEFPLPELGKNFRLTLTGKEYFVLGDNFGRSSDSRALGPILEEQIIGIAASLR